MITFAVDMKRLLLIRCLLTAVMLLSMSEIAMADDHERIGCLVNWTPQSFTREAQTRSSLSDIAYGDRGWDAGSTYRQLVVLVSFADCDFSPEHTADYYRRLFNEDGFNEGKGPGCVAEYFRQQSAGLFNAQFDIYGPVKLEQTASNNSSSANYGASVFQDAVRTLADQDFTPYDWDGNGRAEAVIVIYAGFGGNEKTVKGQGYIWPNTSTLGAPSGGWTEPAAALAPSVTNTRTRWDCPTFTPRRERNTRYATSGT